MATTATERRVTITRVLDAPREVVFRAWIDREQLSRWWGPKGFTNPVCEVDARVGGNIRIVMRAPDGTNHLMKGVFREITALEKLIFTNVAVGQNGVPLVNGLTEVTFSEQAGETTMTLETSASALVPEAETMLNGMSEGWNQSLERLRMLLAV
jgi:uncharacterized protein YndB with AHSA1/START domain